MPVTTRRRAAALAAVYPSSLKTPTSTRRRNSQTPPLPIITSEPARTANGKITGSKRRLKSLSPNETHEIACRFGHRLYDGKALWLSAATTSPTLKGLIDSGVEHQAKFYERKLAQISADLAATGEMDLWKVHNVVDVALAMLRNIGRQ